MPGFKTEFSQFPTFVQQGGAYIPQQQMPPQQPPAPPPPMYVPPVRKSPVKAILITLLVLVLLSSAGFAAVLGMRIWDPLWNPFRPKPEAVFIQTLAKMKETKKYTYQTTGSISFDATDKDGKNIKGMVSLDSGGKMDISDMINPKLDSTLKFSLNLSSSNDSKENVGVFAAGAVKMDDKSVFFRIGSLSAEGSAVEDLSGYMSGLNSIKDVWVEVPKSSLGNTTESALDAKTKAVFDKYQMWNVASQLADEKMGTADVYHYVVSLNKENLKSAFSELVRISIEESGEGSMIGSSIDYYSAAAEGIVSTFLDKIGEVNADVWIGKKDMLVYRINLAKDIDLKQTTGSIIGNLSINFGLVLADHNNPVDVQAPAGAKTFNEVFGPLMLQAEIKARNEKIQADIGQIKAVADALYASKKTYSGLSCKMEGAVSICADLKSQTGEDPKVFGYFKKYCAYSKLMKMKDSDIQEYYCTDYLSQIKTSVDPSQKGYCTGYTFECPKPSPSPTPNQ